MDSANQALELIKKSENILILPPADLQGDSLSSALALLYTLKKIGKNVNLLAEEFPEKFRFLSLDALGDFIISVNTSGKEIAELRYEKNENYLKIYLTLKGGTVEEKDISFATHEAVAPIKKDLIFSFRPNLLITLGVGALEEVGEFFNQNSRLFYETPILNIDNNPSNENFGEINLIEITSCSLAEIATGLIESIDETALDKKNATRLLTGIISASYNFQSPKTCPKTLETASYLIEKGADHQAIIRHLYKTKSIPQIRLLGRVLEKLDFNKEKGLYSASLLSKDFEETQTSSRDLGFVLEELKFNFWKLPSLLILWESHSSPPLVKGVFYSLKQELTEKILANFEGVSKKEGALFLIKNPDIRAAKEEALKALE